ncbi:MULTISPECIES: sigma-70 family RNA polymerase sigma factor [Paracidovorax]|uniref:RNA polymerase, sigma-24 subunit, ECF subfamily n=1 Tax=Paracidovorax avenae (strain ATCC 19860 / DSM 7227 / CCUG 15838 / JCM 20985 / LMG 2117 / NCPPB 1011) TaxID=643561 RepID=F0QBM3_PARA1|nr:MULTISPECIES: sigma-70 family RNA polymerase sigma factor [Comamonadaceae]ADX47382.1 RNA polymerase, sigma-24 subunit, ECF subfamily [Paracidovorax avenae ATCC 19860]AVS66417.1 RNA polymerase subunit sigma [Paracidovorax avenae]AVS78614.1 RNA polymerase subunit sigma [Paracidovorax avenae]AVS82141.1 RNA polymerase subunit sigma [Paracidovorax avenae]AVS89356.1 RNA polymerase subunit sigma [Paracidovorax avenae]
MTIVRKPLAEQPPARTASTLPPYLSIVSKYHTEGLPSSPSSEAWIALVRAVADHGDRQAFAALFKHFAPRVKAYLMRLGLAEGVAEDLAQEAMVNLWRRAGTFDPAHAGVSTWVFTIARNLRIDHLRRKSNQLSDSDEGLDIAMDDDGPEELTYAAQCESDVRRAIESLAPEQAQVLRRSFFEDQPHARIAEDLGIPLGTVKSRVRLAVRHLRRLLGAHAP